MGGLTRNIFDAHCSCWQYAPWPHDNDPSPFKAPVHAVVTIGAFLKASRGGKFAGYVEATRDMMQGALNVQYSIDNPLPWDNEADLKAKRSTYLRLYKMGKENAPCAVLQGVCPSRQAEGFESYTNVLCIDIDSAKPGEAPNGNEWVESWEQVKTQLGTLPWVSYCALSAGGRGVFLLIPIARADASSYAAYYETWAALLRDKLGLIADPACKNINRLRFMTYDPTPAINNNAMIWDKVLNVPNDWREGVQLTTPCTLNTEQKGKVRFAASYCQQNGICIADSYEDWLHLAAFFAHCWDDAEGREIFHALASMSHKYRMGENERKLRNLGQHHPNPVKFGTFVKMCRDHGVPIPGKAAASWTPWPTPAPSSSVTECHDTWTTTGTMAGTVQKRAERPQDDTKTATRVITPPQPKKRPDRPSMSASEARGLELHRAFIAEGQGMLQRMRKENPRLDALCIDLDLDYCGHYDNEGRGWTMSAAQFDTVTAGDC